ncbi:MAG: hypothetical protein KBI01_10440 [Oscillospiraceae bacterium]|nr:hypothetical protein [Oscillospiraceae bacterium]
MSDEEIITETVNTEFRKENVISVNYDSTNKIVQTKAIGKDNLTSKMTIDGMYLSMSNILENLSDFKDINISFEIVYPLVDEYGNSTDTTVITASFTSTTRNKINWDYFLIENMPDVADEWWMHPALTKAMN